MTYTRKIAFASARGTRSDFTAETVTPGAVAAVLTEFSSRAPVAPGPLWPFLANDLDRARNDGELEIIYQPVVDSTSCAVVALEALAHWTHPRFGVISPEQLMAVAAASGGMNQLGDWMLDAACQEAATWEEHVSLCVNLTLGQLENRGLSRRIEKLLEQSGLPATRLQLEISEHCRLGEIPTLHANLANLRATGVRITLDDFGAAWGNLTNLRHLPLDTIKLDRSFVDALDGDARTPAIIRSILDLANDLGLDVIADGVETTAQLRFLRNHGCRHVQGFLIARPSTRAQLVGGRMAA